MFCSGKVRHGAAGEVCQGVVRNVKLRPGVSWQARLGKSMSGWASYGLAWRGKLLQAQERGSLVELFI